jgi:hypothetical protein
MFYSNIVTPHPETILVASANTAMPVTGALIDGANNRINSNLPSGVLGIVSAEYGQTTAKDNFIPNADATVAKNRFIKIVQGTPGSSSLTNGAFPDEHPPVVASTIIDGKNLKTFTGRVYVRPQANAWVIDGVTAISEKEYNLHIGFTGVRNDREFSISGIEMLSTAVVTPDFTAPAVAEPVDWVLQNLAYKVNLNSAALGITAPTRARGNKNVIVFGVNKAGINNAGGTIGVDIASIVVGTDIDVLVAGGVTYTYKATQQTLDTLAALIAASSDIDGDSTIVPIDLSVAGAPTHISHEFDALIVMALDRKPARVTDLEVATKVRLHVGLDGYFTETNAVATELVRPYEGANSGKFWKIQYDSYHGLNRYTNQVTEMGEAFIVPPSYVDATKTYNAFVIEHMDTETIAYSHTNYFPKRTIILVEASTVGVGLANVITSLNSGLGAWLGSASIERVLKPHATNFFV